MAYRHALITGGSSGIGLALARLLARQGWALTLIARDRECLESARAELSQISPSPVQSIAADVSHGAEIAAAVEEALETLGTPELVVTSAGVARPGHFHELTDPVFEEAMAVNYFGTLNTVRALLPALRRAGRGRIVMVSSGAALVGVYGYGAYSPSKFAVRGLAEVLRCELKPDGIAVSIVYPPDTDTPQLEQENRSKPDETRAISAGAGVWRPEAVAETILRGIERDRFAITPGLEMGLLNRLHSLIAPLLHGHFDRLVRKVRQGR